MTTSGYNSHTVSLSLLLAALARCKCMFILDTITAYLKCDVSAVLHPFSMLLGLLC